MGIAGDGPIVYGTSEKRRSNDRSDDQNSENSIFTYRVNYVGILVPSGEVLLESGSLEVCRHFQFSA